MKPIFIYALVVTCLIVKGYSEPIQCYDCEDCKELNDDMLILCPPDETTPSTEENSSSENSSSADGSTTALTGNTDEANDISAEVTEGHKARKSRQVNYKSVMTKRSVENTVSYQCFSIVKNGTEGKEIKKGCVEVPADEKGCDVLKEVEGVSEENCKVCSESKCNSSVGLKYCFVTVFLVAVMKAFL